MKLKTMPLPCRTLDATAEPGRDMLEREVVLSATIKRCRSDKLEEPPDTGSIILVYYKERIPVS